MGNKGIEAVQLTGERIGDNNNNNKKQSDSDQFDFRVLPANHREQLHAVYNYP
jgi:hypothetical protein